MKTKFFVLSVLLFVCAGAFARNGALSGTKGDLKVVKTQYFDIIYAEESEHSALKIASVCDDYYLEICQKLNTTANHRFPVTITQSVEQLNAYFTTTAYNRIVLFDTKPEDSLDMFEDTICYVFYHELTHAVTWNIKTAFWRGMSSVFGDIMNPAMVTVTTFWSEGATVSFESERGNSGRLNDPFSTQLAGSYKLDNKFPDWRDVSGARDVYPGGTDAYIFGGLFCHYLQEKYGYEKYGQLWEKSGSLSYVNRSFKKVYGKSVTEEWKEFEKTVYCPESVKPVQPVSHELSYIGALDNDFNYDSAAENELQQVVYYDSKTKGLYLIKDGSAPERVLTIAGVFEVHFENNNVVMNRYVNRDNTKIQKVIYNLDSKKLEYAEPEKEESVFLKNRIVKHSENHYCQLYKEGLSWKLMYKNGQIEKQFDFSKVTGKNSLIVHNLNQEKYGDKESYIFTWAEIGKAGEMMSRIGRLVIDPETKQGKLYLEKADDFAGVTDIVSDGTNYYAVLQRRQSKPLVKVELDDSMFQEYEIGQEAHSWNTYNEESKNVPHYEKGDLKIKSYNPFAYMHKGILYPFSMVEVYDSDFENDYNCYLGTTFMTSNPWGDKNMSLSGGYNPNKETAAFSAQLNGGNNSLTYSLTGQFAFKPQEDWKQSVEFLDVEKRFAAGKVSSYGVNFNGKLFNQWEEKAQDSSLHETTGDVKSGLFLTTIHKSGPHYFDMTGIKINPFVNYQHHWLDMSNDSNNDKNYINAGLTADVRVPVVFPWKFTASLYPKRDVFASGSADVVLFNHEIQKAIPGAATYVRRFYLTSAYTAKLNYKSGSNFDIKDTKTIASDMTADNYEDCLSVAMNLAFVPNIGFFAGIENFGVSYVLSYYPHEQDNGKKLKYGLSWNIGM